MNQEYSYFLDTNILVHVSLEDYDKEKYKKSQAILKKFYQEEYQIYISTQIIREFYAVVTNAKYLKNPLTPKQAIDQIKYFQKQFNVLSIDNNVISELMKLTVEHNIKAQKIHDTTIAATMIQYGIKNILTYNKKDFENFKKIKVAIP